MKVSYNWLQEYIQEPLPSIDTAIEALTMHSFEVEGFESVGDDKVLDIKILPNRAHDCLSHYGIASEIAAVMGLSRVELLLSEALSPSTEVTIEIKTKLSKRATMVLIKNLKIGESPEWLKEKLKVLGHKSINSVVDVTNYLTYAYGQPMHAFDADKIAKGKKGTIDITIREAKEGEKITLLNGKEYTLQAGMVVIADKDKALDVAGVMGGKESEVTSSTENILLSLSHFDPVSIRKTAKTLGIRTDASHRFENGISMSQIDRALPYALKHITELAHGGVEGITDVIREKEEAVTVSVTAEKISSVLGVVLSSKEIIDLLGKQKIDAVEKGGAIIVTPSRERLDLTIPESIAEEVGRLYGYGKIAPAYLEPLKNPEVNLESHVSDSIREALSSEGFSEIYTYSFRDSGVVQIENPLAGDKKYLRKDLMSGMEESLEFNSKYLDLLGMSSVRLFEIGKVFREDGEFLHLAIGVWYPKNKKGLNTDEEVARAIKLVESKLRISVGDVSIVGGMAEIHMDRITKEVVAPETYGEYLSLGFAEGISYSPISQYPFAVRDVAVFVPNAVTVDAVREIIQKHTTPIVVRLSLFDTFVKGDKTSYAWRLVFQSKEKTLTDEEINTVMNPIYDTLKGQEGFEIR